MEVEEPVSERSWYTYHEDEGQLPYGTEDMGQDLSHLPTDQYYRELYDPYVENDFPDVASFVTPEEDTGTDEEDVYHPSIAPTGFVSDDDYNSGSTNHQDSQDDTYEENDTGTNEYDIYVDPSYVDDYNDGSDGTTDLAQMLENTHISHQGWQLDPEHEEYHDPEGEEWQEDPDDVSFFSNARRRWEEESDQRQFEEAYDIPNILRMINEEHQNDPSWDPPPSVHGASPAELERLPRRRLDHDEDKEVIESECSICQDVFGTELYLTRLPCQHEYHAMCIEQWLLRNASCPICRSQVLIWSSSSC